MLPGKGFRRHDVRCGDGQFIFEPCDDAALPRHHGLEAGLIDIGRIVLIRLSDFGIEQISTPEECRSAAANKSSLWIAARLRRQGATMKHLLVAAAFSLLNLLHSLLRLSCKS
jgi:hypothetical protein